MQSYLSRDLATERQRRLLSDAERLRLADQATASGRRAPMIARALGGLLIALGSRLGGAIPTVPAPVEPARPAPEHRAATAP